MTNTKLISIIIPLYNKEKWIFKTIQSVLTQSYKNIEIIIINDGSTDNSLKIVKKINDNRIKIINQKNKGVSNARNVGLEKAKGDYIAFIDADDLWNNKHLEKAAFGFLNDSKIVLSANLYIDNRNKRKFNLESLFKKKKEINDTKYYIFNNYLELISKNIFIIHTSTILIKREIIQKNKLKFDEQLKIGEDVNFWLKLSLLGSFSISNYIGGIYNREDLNSLMNNQENQVRYVPNFFKGIDIIKNYDKKNKSYIEKLLKNSYISTAHYNRGLPFKKEEINNKYIKQNFSPLIIFLYLLIRFMPNLIYKLIKK